MVERGVDVSYETIWRWISRYDSVFAKRIHPGDEFRNSLHLIALGLKFRDKPKHLPALDFLGTRGAMRLPHREVGFGSGGHGGSIGDLALSLIHISEPTSPRLISYAVFCL